jgi:hypothetical protein
MRLCRLSSCPPIPTWTRSFTSRRARSRWVRRTHTSFKQVNRPADPRFHFHRPLGLRSQPAPLCFARFPGQVHGGKPPPDRSLRRAAAAAMRLLRLAQRKTPPDWSAPITPSNESPKTCPRSRTNVRTPRGSKAGRPRRWRLRRSPDTRVKSGTAPSSADARRQRLTRPCDRGRAPTLLERLLHSRGCHWAARM